MTEPEQKFYAVTAPNGTIFVTAKDADRVEAALRAASTHVRVGEKMIALNAGTGIYPAAEYIAMQNEQLNAHRRWMCRSGTVHEAESRCECSRETRVVIGPSLITRAFLEAPKDTPAIPPPRTTKTLPEGHGMTRLGDMLPGRKTDENHTPPPAAQ